MNKFDRKHLELLAPGGSLAGVKAAFQAGADAVYMGGNRFSARAYAESATEENALEQAIDYAHLHDRQLYLTLNTLIKTKELEQELYDYVAPLYERGIDAVLVQDLGALSFLHREFPDLVLHASTQMTVTSAASAKMLKNMGMSRVVAARELNLKELANIYQETRMELEAFVHGAICYCYSGQCLYSGVIGGRSGNRGRCAQPCRLPYTATDLSGNQLNKPAESYLLSLKDMCTLQYLPDMSEAGVMSFKIEGRMKSPVYTAGVVSIYRKYLDQYLENGRKNWKVDQRDLYALSQYFDRGGFTDQYLTAHNGREMMSLKEKARMRTPDQRLIKETEEKYVGQELKESIDGVVTIYTGESAVLCLEKGDIQVTAISQEPVASAMKRPLSEADVKKQFSKMGGTPFKLNDLQIYLSEDAFMPVQAMNNLRREALEKLEQAIKGEYQHIRPEKIGVEQNGRGNMQEIQEKDNQKKKLSFIAQISSLKYLPIVLNNKMIDTIYLESTCVKFEQLKELADRCHQKGKQLFLVVARIWREAAIREWKKQYQLVMNSSLDGLVVGSLDVLQELIQISCKLPVIIDHTLYSWNPEAKKQIASLPGMEHLQLLRFTAPLELNEKELKDRGCEDSEIQIYGYLPMMVTAGCVRKTTGRCTHADDVTILTDRKDISFADVCCCKYCYNIIYNSLPGYLLDKRSQIMNLNPAAVRLSFTVETEAQVKSVLNDLNQLWSDSTEKDSCNIEAKSGSNSITRGHFTRGVL